MSDPKQPRIAIFFDAENFIICAQQAGLPVRLRRLVNRIREDGVICFARAYGDWSKYHMSRQMNEFQENVIEMNQLPSRYGKNTADMQIVVDALEMAILPASPETFVLVAGDRDFIPLVQKLKRYGKSVIGIGVKGATSGWLERICNTFLYYDNLVPEMDQMDDDGRPSPPPAADPAAADQSPAVESSAAAAQAGPREHQEAFRLLVRAVASLERNGKQPTGNACRLIMQQLDPTFDLSSLRFATFKEFARAAADDRFVELDDLDGEEFRLRALVQLAETDEEGAAGADLQMIFDNPEDAREAYRTILQDKGIALIPWEQRVMLVNYLWERFAASEGRQGFTIAEMSDVLMECAQLNMLSIPQRAIHKLTYSLNLGHVFMVDGECRFVNDIWHTRILPSCDADEALNRINATYIEGIRRARPEANLDPNGLELLIFDRSDKRTAAKLRELFKRLKSRGGIAFDKLPASR